MIKDEKWPAARLIPISSASGVEAQERRLASALLAVMSSVPEFGYALLKPFGAPVGKIETFIEVPFKMGDRAILPDGVITVTRAGKSCWPSTTATGRSIPGSAWSARGQPDKGTAPGPGHRAESHP